jgi:hypothetical protein
VAHIQCPWYTSKRKKSGGWDQAVEITKWSSSLPCGITEALRPVRKGHQESLPEEARGIPLTCLCTTW